MTKFILILSFIIKIYGKLDEKQCSIGIDRAFLIPLYSYSNTFLGAFRDHFASTWTVRTHPKALHGYYQIDTFGLIANSTNPINAEKFRCECLQEVVQLYDEQMGLGGSLNKPGLFGRIDHKLVHSGDEKNEVFEKYMKTGEKLYCVPEYGQCGASVPLYKWFAASEIDSFITTHDTIEKESDANLASKGILCYIWSSHYKSGNGAPHVPQYVSSHDHQNEHSHPGNYLAMIQARELSHGFSNRDLTCSSLIAANGQWSYTTPSRSPGTVAFLNCNSGYAVVKSSAAVICQRTGRWLPEPPKCHLAGCPPIDQTSPPTHGHIIYNSGIISDRLYPIGTTAMLVCGEKMDVGHDGADVSYCSASGWQPRTLGRCERVCPLFLVENGQVVYTDARGFDQVTNTNGTIATVICEPGTQLTGVGTSVCIDGVWNVREIGQCKLLNCPRFPGFSHGQLIYFNARNQPIDPNKTKIVPGTTVKLTCSHGKHLMGAGESICHSSEKWLPQIGTCF